MRSLTLMLTLCCATFFGKAQHIKVSLTQGLGYSPTNKNDSIFFAKQHYATQLRLGYHYGRIGFIANATYIKQQNIKEAIGDDRVPFNFQGIAFFPSNLNTLLTNFGLEVCTPIIPKKLFANFYATYGMSMSKSDSVSLKDSTLLLYSHKASKQLGGSFQSGFSLNYNLNSHLAIKWQNEFDRYKIKFDGFDSRKSPSVYAGYQSKSLIITSLGLQYKF